MADKTRNTQTLMTAPDSSSILNQPLPVLPPEPSDIQRAGLTRNTRFLRLWLGQIFAHPAVHIVYFSLFLRIYDLTGSNFMVSILLAIISAAPIFFSSFAGVLADRVNRKWILFSTNLTRSVLMFFLFFLADSITAVMIAAFLLSTVSNIYQPAENASVPTVSARGQLFLTNTVYMFTIYISIFTGYAFSGPFLSAFGDVVFLISSGLFFVACVINLTLPSLNPTQWQRDRGHLISGSLKQTALHFREGVDFIRKHPVIILTIFQVVFIFSMERAIVAVVPDMVHNFLQISLEELSLFIITPLGFGALIGGLAGNMLKRRYSKRHIVNMGLFLHAFAMIFFPMVWTVPAFLNGGLTSNALQLISMSVLAFTSGLADVIIIISAQTLLHEQASEDKRGRVVGNVFALMNLVGVPVVLFVGGISERISITWIIVILGLFLLLASVIGFRWSKKVDIGQKT